jgi:hypothetical protein
MPLRLLALLSETGFERLELAKGRGSDRGVRL